MLLKVRQAWKIQVGGANFTISTSFQIPWTWKIYMQFWQYFSSGRPGKSNIEKEKKSRNLQFLCYFKCFRSKIKLSEGKKMCTFTISVLFWAPRIREEKRFNFDVILDCTDLQNPRERREKKLLFSHYFRFCLLEK